MNIIECFLSLSRSLDFNRRGLMHHHHRTALIAVNIGKAAGLSPDELLELFQASVIHDIGVISWKEKAGLEKFEIDSPWEHCLRGSEMVRRHSSLHNLSRAILSHHDRWAGPNPSGLERTHIPLASRIIHLADRVDISIKPNQYILEQRKPILDKLWSFEGTLFEPDLLAVFAEISKRDSFWFDLASTWQEEIIKEIIPLQVTPTDTDFLLDIARLFARVVDAKSHFTYRHSRGVAAVAGFMGEQLALSPENCALLEIAGLLHDLGKLSISGELLEKPESLTAAEFNTMKRHSYYTYWLLKPLTNTFPLAEWAAFHHEKPNGKGYPFAKKSEELDLNARLITVADIFVALREERPYRRSMDWDQIIPIMNNLARVEGLDMNQISIILDNRKLLDRKWEEISEK